MEPSPLERLAVILTTYIEEWGIEAITVHLPASWRAAGFKSLGSVGIKYEDTDTLTINVNYETASLSYRVLAASILV